MADTSRSARIALRPWLEHLLVHAERARSGDDGECAHEVRVAAARIETWLRMAGLRVLRDDLKALRHAAAEQRDFDVVLRRELPAAFREWAVAQRERAHAQFLAMLVAPRTGALFAALAWLPDVRRSTARAYHSEARALVTQRAVAALRPKSSVDELHELRRAVRRLRYVGEWLGLATSEAKALQDELGALNDAAVALELAVVCPHVDELREWREQLARRVRLHSEAARDTCKRAMLPRRRHKP